ncbi:hypothetical protein ACHAC9_12525 [Massilia sp. CMS3.1]|uniref:hypothetical protein n=1 Tax=Massilia sp. CMS3.1 TaxID=3373083 RepID=UPI003EE6F667
MPFVQAVTEFSFLLPPIAELVRGALVLALLASVVLFFRPLLSGLVRAFILTVRPRLSRQERAARQQRNALSGRA